MMRAMSLSTLYLTIVAVVLDRRDQAVGAVALALVASVLLGVDGAEAGKRIITGGSGDGS
jgi:hypothetical protein